MEDPLLTDVPVLPTYPVVRLPLDLQRALASEPKLEAFAGTEPEPPTWKPTLRLQLSTSWMRLFGQGSRARDRLEEVKKPLMEQHQASLEQHHTARALFEASQQERLTPEALRQHRVEQVQQVLARTVPEKHREGYSPLSAAEARLWPHLHAVFAERIARHVVLSLPGHGEHVPAFAYIDPTTNLRLCIEIDLPFDAAMQPLHLVEWDPTTGSWQGADDDLEQQVLALGWGMVRFSEQQVHRDPAGCAAFLVHTLADLYLQPLEPPLEQVQREPRWTSLTLEHLPPATGAGLQQPEPVPPPFALPDPTLDQRKVLQFIEGGQGHGLVLGVPGGGKTTTALLTARAQLQLHPRSRVLLVTFSEQQREQLQQQVQALNLSPVDVHTPHSFGLEVLQDHFGTLSVESLQERSLAYVRSSLNTRYAANHDADSLTVLVLMHLCKVLQIDHRHLLEVTRLAETQGITAATVRDLHPILVEGMERGLQHLQRHKKVDWDDLCWLPIQLGVSFPGHDLVLIDGCENLNETQLELVLRALKTRGRILFIGDESQVLQEPTVPFAALRELGTSPFLLSEGLRSPRSHVEVLHPFHPLLQAAPDALEGKVVHLSWEALCSQARPGDLMVGPDARTVRQALYRLVKCGRRFQFTRVPAASEPLNPQDPAGPVVPDALQSLLEVAQEVAGQCVRSGLSFTDELRTSMTRAAAQGQLEKLNQLQALQQLERSQTCKTPQDVLDVLETQLQPDPGGVMLCTAVQARGMQAERVFVLGFDPAAQPDSPVWRVALSRSLHTLFLVSDLQS